MGEIKMFPYRVVLDIGLIGPMGEGDCRCSINMTGIVTGGWGMGLHGCTARQSGTGGRDA